MTHTGGVTVVKQSRRRETESFQSDKLQKSIIAACLSAGANQGQSDVISKRVLADVEKWLENKHEVTTDDIRHIAGKSLQKYHNDSAYFYQQHRKII